MGTSSGEESYHSRPEVSATQLKSMAAGWRQFEAEHVTKTAIRKESLEMALGTAIHAALLEPKVYEREFVVTPKDASDRRTKAYKEWAATVGGKRILSLADAEVVGQVVHQVEKSEIVRQTLAMDGQAEQEVFWTDQETQVKCRAKLDKLCGNIVLDVKTTDDARPPAFASTIGKYRYDLQAAHYLDGTGGELFIFIAVEKAAPFRVRLYEIAPIDLSDAIERRHELLRCYADRAARNDWAEDLEQEVVTLFIPNYLKG